MAAQVALAEVAHNPLKDFTSRELPMLVAVEASWVDCLEVAEARSAEVAEMAAVVRRATQA